MFILIKLIIFGKSRLKINKNTKSMEKYIINNAEPIIT